MTVRLIPKNDLSASDGFSGIDLLIVVVIVMVVVTYALAAMVRAQKPALRINAARQFENYLEQARNDSMRRRATVASQMAQVTILNDRNYTVTLDANGDGVLDMPLVVSLAQQRVTFNGPFPRSFIFDSLGRDVDLNANVIHPTPITLANSSGASVVKISEGGQLSIVQP